jgi:xanthine dehydrogenase accessory factor
MREIRDIVRLFETHHGESMALATLVRTRGSSYRRPGARMLVTADGAIAGSLSGGCLEEEVVRRAFETIRTGMPELMNFDTRLRFGCHGSIDVFIERVCQAFLEELAANFRQRRSCRALTVFAVAPGNLGSRFVARDENIPPESFVHEIEPAIRVLAFGEGPDSVGLRMFAQTLGWEFVDMNDASELPAKLDKRTAAIVKTHNYGRDFAALSRLLKLDLPYVGLLGPRKRRDQLLHALLDDGVPINAEVFAPAGLDLGAETPEELALSVVSEIQATFAGASAEPLRDRKAPIHGWNVARRAVPFSSQAWVASAP